MSQQVVSNLQAFLDMGRVLVAGGEELLPLIENRAELQARHAELQAGVKASEERLAALREAIIAGEAKKAEIEEQIRQGDIRRLDVEREVQAVKRKLTEAVTG